MGAPGSLLLIPGPYPCPLSPPEVPRKTPWWEGDICTQPSACLVPQHGQLTQCPCPLCAQGERRAASGLEQCPFTSYQSSCRGCHSEAQRHPGGVWDPDRTEALQTGTCFFGRRDCGFRRVFVRVTRPLAGQARRCVRFSYMERDEHHVPQTWTHDASKRSEVQALGTPRTSRAYGTTAAAPGGHRGPSLWLGLHSGPSSEPGRFR